MVKRGWGERLKERARALGLSDAAVARALGLTQRRYSSYANETRTPDYDTLARICRVLETSPDAVLGFDEPPSPTARDGLRARMAAAAAALDGRDLERAVVLMEALAAFTVPGRSTAATKAASARRTRRPRVETAGSG